MSTTQPQHPPAIRRLAERLGIAPASFIDESHLGRRGFFRHGRRTADARRYCLEGDRIIGLCLRGAELTDLEWLAEADFQYLEDLLLGENAFDLLDFPAGCTRLRRVDLSNSPRLRRVGFAGPTDELERLEITDGGLYQLTLPAAGCPRLQFLDLSRSEVKKLRLPGSCPSLHSLHLRAAAQLEVLDIAAPLPALDTLELINCGKLRELPARVLLNSPLERLYLSGCVPRNCPSYLCDNNSVDGTRVWFRELAKGFGVNKRVKLLISGNGYVGKSTLQCALAKIDPESGTDVLACNCKEEHQTTHGILIDDFTCQDEDITFNYWDFGGQDVYGATHRLFYADEAVQLLVFDPRYEAMARRGEEGTDQSNGGMEQKHQIEYFHAIQRQKSRYDTFIIVQNKYDKRDPEGQVDYAGTDTDLERYATEKLNGRFLHVDARNGYRIDDLLEVVIAQGKALPRYGMKFPLTWLAVRRWFIDNDGKKSGKEQRITTRIFREEICNPRGVTEKDAQVEILRFLESAGYCYVMKKTSEDGEEGEGADIIVDQEWALRAIYRPLHREDVAPLWKRLRGLIPVSMIYDAFGTDYREEDKALLLNFMVENGLCFPAFAQKENQPGAVDERERDYIFPTYRPTHNPEALTFLSATKEVLRFRAPVPFLNRTEFQGFLCRLGSKVDAFHHLTRYGIFLRTEAGCLGARMNYAERCYEVFCEPAAAPVWLESLLEECPSGEKGWKILRGKDDEPFDVREFFGQSTEREGKDLKTDLLDRIANLSRPPADARMRLAEFKEELEGYLTNNRFDLFFARVKEMVKRDSARYPQIVSLLADYNDYSERKIGGRFRAEEELSRKQTLIHNCVLFSRNLDVEDWKG